LAHDAGTQNARQHHADLAAFPLARTQPCRKHLAVYLRQNWLSNSVFENYDAIIDAACNAWNKLIALPDVIKSIGMREWPHVGQRS